jgi:CheY-like chemotaxis protein/HPt (histidine-containing phosphotransfer) domain-containing protein/uncharacterized membrane-anchored protein YhcB (DUF1043 family)
MRSRLRIVLIWFFLVSGGFADVYFIFDSGQDKTKLENGIKEIQNRVSKYLKISGLVKKLKFKPYVYELNDGYILRSNTLPSTDTTALLYLELKRLYPKLYFVERGSSSKVIQHTKVVTVEKPIIIEEEKSFTIWIALFGLAIIGVFALFLSSSKVQHLVKVHREIQKKHEEMEQRISEMFSMMGENIHKLSKDIVQYTSDMLKETSSHPIKNKLEKVVNAESRILDSATNLLDFLHLKAKKVTVKKEHFNINNMLDDMLENLVKNTSREDIELIFDIDKSMPKFILGDFKHIGEIFGKILEHAIAVATSKHIKVELSSNDPYMGGLELQATITYSSTLDIGSSYKYFMPIYNESIGQYERLGLYVAHELIKLMDGESSVEYDDKSNVYTIGITILIEESPDKDRRKYHLSTKEYMQKDILIVNRNYEASLALKKLFTYFRHRVRVLTLEKFKKENIDFSNYNILMIDERLLDENLSNRLESQKGLLKIVGLESIFSQSSKNSYYNVTDIRATRPMTQEKALSLIEDLYMSSKKKRQTRTSVVKRREPRREFRATIPETENISLKDFGDFSGRRIMIVEDNYINTKMLLRVLEYSGMDILVAENGQDALNKVTALRAGELDLILMDINMPIMDGYTATRKIRQMNIWKKLPIIALSALSLENEFKRMKDFEMDGYIPKPLNIGQLYSVFDIFLKKEHSSKLTTASGKADRKLIEIKGIDLRLALDHVNNNEMLLKEVLSEFINLYGESDKEIAKLYRDRRFEQLKKYIFDIAGLASTIGAKNLAANAQEIKKLYIYDKLELIPNHLKEYQKALNEIKDSLKEYLE